MRTCSRPSSTASSPTPPSRRRSQSHRPRHQPGRQNSRPQRSSRLGGACGTCEPRTPGLCPYSMRKKTVSGIVLFWSFAVFITHFLY